MAVRCIQEISDAKKTTPNLCVFLTLLYAKLAVLMRQQRECNSKFLKSVSDQLINIIDYQCLVFSADPERLEDAELQYLVNKLAELPVVGDRIKKLRSSIHPFGGIMAHHCGEIMAAEKAECPTYTSNIQM
jgi:hypothetical protein